MEINLRHGHPLELADQVFLFKRTIREAALRLATFGGTELSLPDLRYLDEDAAYNTEHRRRYGFAVVTPYPGVSPTAATQ